MSDPIDRILIEAQRGARDNAFNAAIELCELVEQIGGCPRCCKIQIEQLRREMQAHDLAEDALERARHG